MKPGLTSKPGHPSKNKQERSTTTTSNRTANINNNSIPRQAGLPGYIENINTQQDRISSKSALASQHGQDH
jgi:hypothetical protein